MNENDILIDLEEPVGRLSSGINAIGLMTLGMLQAEDPYADGFQAVWNYLRDAEMDVQAVLNPAREVRKS